MESVVAQEEKDLIAFELLREVIALGRNNHPYNHKLNELDKALDDAPMIRRVICDSLKTSSALH